MSSACVQAQCTEHTNKDVGAHRQQQKAPPPQNGQCDGSPTPEALKGLGGGDVSWTCVGSQAIAQGANMDYYFEKYVYAAVAKPKESHFGEEVLPELAAARNFARKACAQYGRRNADPWAPRAVTQMAPSAGREGGNVSPAGRSCRKRGQGNVPPLPTLSEWVLRAVRQSSFAGGSAKKGQSRLPP